MSGLLNGYSQVLEEKHREVVERIEEEEGERPHREVRGRGIGGANDELAVHGPEGDDYGHDDPREEGPDGDAAIA